MDSVNKTVMQSNLHSGLVCRADCVGIMSQNIRKDSIDGDDHQMDAIDTRLTSVADKKAELYDGLSPVRCFNYDTQLRVAGDLITESLESNNSAVLILDKNAESALDKLEDLGFTLRQALLDRKLDIYYYRNGVRERTFFKKDYQSIFDETLKQRVAPVQHIVMVEFNTLFANSVKDAIDNQIEDFCEVARQYNVCISGLYSPHSWHSEDFLTERLPSYIGTDVVREAKVEPDTGELSIRLPEFRNTTS